MAPESGQRYCLTRRHIIQRTGKNNQRNFFLFIWSESFVMSHGLWDLFYQ